MYIYPYSLEYAIRCHERDLWRESYQLNCGCARAIENAIAENYDGRRLSGECAKAVLGEYGIDRVNWVLANTIHEKTHDGRFSRGNKEWATGFTIPQDTTQLQFVVDSHPGLVNLFTDTVRHAWQKLGLFDSTHCTSKNEDFEGKVLVLKPTILKDEYKTPDFQLFLADGGFGCSPTARGRKVYGRFLKDGEETHYERQDFLGVLKDEHLPDWAREKLAEIKEQAQDSGQEMTQRGECMKIKIYQINSQRDPGMAKFMGLARLKAPVDPASYDEVFSGDVDCMNLEDVFAKFNTEGHPLHRGHSLSVSDVVLTEDGAFFCDIIGFKSIDFDESKAHKPDDLLKIVYVEPNRPPYISEVGNDLKSLQRAVDGHMETVYMGDSTILICNEEGKVKGMDCNRRVGDDVIAGPFFIVGEDGEDFRSLTDEETERYMERFAQPVQIEQEEVQNDMGFSMHFF